MNSTPDQFWQHWWKDLRIIYQNSTPMTSLLHCPNRSVSGGASWCIQCSPSHPAEPKSWEGGLEASLFEKNSITMYSTHLQFHNSEYVHSSHTDRILKSGTTVWEMFRSCIRSCICGYLRVFYWPTTIYYTIHRRLEKTPTPLNQCSPTPILDHMRSVGNWAI